MLTAVDETKMLIPWPGRRSMMMLNVSHMLARENQVKISVKMLYYVQVLGQRDPLNVRESTGTYKGLDVEEEHANDTMARPVELEEVDNTVL